MNQDNSILDFLGKATIIGSIVTVFALLSAVVVYLSGAQIDITQIILQVIGGSMQSKAAAQQIEAVKDQTKVVAQVELDKVKEDKKPVPPPDPPVPNPVEQAQVKPNV